jgi:hypothetical protein
VLRLKEMDVSRGDDGLADYFAQPDYPSVVFEQLLFAFDLSAPDEKGVVAAGLYFEEIIEFG